MSHVRRREFVTLLGGAAAAWPLAARAQQGEPMRRVGLLVNLAADDPIGQARVAAFVQGLQAAGWVEGRNVRIDIRWAATSTDAAEIRRHAAELVALAPDVILASGGTTLGPLRQVSRTVPTVFTGVGDPVGAGFVDSLARPGGNATGFIAFEWSISGKWLELLKEIAPGVTRAVVLRDTEVGSGASQFAVIQALAPSLRVEVNPVNVGGPAEIERAPLNPLRSCVFRDFYPPSNGAAAVTAIGCHRARYAFHTPVHRKDHCSKSNSLPLFLRIVKR